MSQLQSPYPIPSGLVRLTTAAILTAGLYCQIAGAIRVLKWTGSLQQLPDWWQPLLAVLLTAAATATAQTLAAMLRGRLQPTAFDLRTAVAGLVGGSVAFLLVVDPYAYSLALIWWGSLAAAWGLSLHFGGARRWMVGTGTGRVLDLLVFNVSAGVAMLFAGLLAAGWLFPSSLLSIGSDADRQLTRMRCQPHQLRFGFPCNSRGYYDHEPDPGRRPRVAVVGDSFVQGIVPHSRLFTTVAERLSGVAVDSFGVPSIGPPEYRLILAEDVLPLDPDLVIFAVFAGNDVGASHFNRGRHQGQRWLRIWLSRPLNPVWTVAGRLNRLRREFTRGRSLAGIGEPGMASASIPADASADSVQDRREPTYSWTNYVELAARLAAIACRPDPSVYGPFFADLQALVDSSPEGRVAVFIIPDEFQVEDRVWAGVVENSDPGLERDLPQIRMRRWLHQREIPYLDLLPLFRAETPQPDGDRHLYHPQDSHLNIAGNEVAGRHLADLIERLLTDGRRRR